MYFFKIIIVTFLAIITCFSSASASTNMWLNKKTAMLFKNSIRCKCTFEQFDIRVGIVFFKQD